ncbi:MAG: hypothetical protein Q9180_007887, partial [Flavoplaca navasiana]
EEPPLEPFETLPIVAPNNGGTTCPYPISSTGETTTLVPDEITKAVDRMLVEVGPLVPLWKDVVDADGSKLMLERAVLMPLRYPEVFVKSPPSNGLLLYGPSGSGKTTLVKSLVRESNCRMLEVTHGGLLSKWQGDTEKVVKAIFDKAKAIAPCIIFVDNIEATLRKRTSNDDYSISSMKSELRIQWSSLEGSNVIVIGATNLPETIDVAFLRRLDHLIYVGLPGPAARFRLLKSQCQSLDADVSSELLNNLATGATGGLTCDEIIRCMRDVVKKLCMETVEPNWFVMVRDTLPLLQSILTFMK